MNILLVSQFNKHSILGGGEAVVAFQQVKSLVKNGHAVAMLTHGDLDEIVYDNELQITFIFAKTLGVAPFGYMSLGKSQFLFLENSLRVFKPDIIHSHTMNYLALMAQGFALKDHIRFLYTTHELPDKLIHFFRFGKTLQSISAFFVYALVKAFLTNVDKVLAINQASKDSTLRLGYKNQIDIVHNGVDIHLYSSLNSKFPTREVNLYFVGGINERKNQYYLIKTMQYLPSSFYLYLVGSSENQYQIKLEVLSENIGVKNRVIFTGNIDNQALPKAIENYHVFVSASKMEVQSVAVIEALAAAKPIVALNNETIEEFVGSQSVSILAQDSSPEEFAKAILEMVSDQTKYLSRANEAQQLSKDYTKEEAYELNIQAYKTTQISTFRNHNSYRLSMLAYIVVVGSLYRIRQFLNVFGLWR